MADWKITLTVKNLTNKYLVTKDIKVYSTNKITQSEDIILPNSNAEFICVAPSMTLPGPELTLNLIAVAPNTKSSGGINVHIDIPVNRSSKRKIECFSSGDLTFKITPNAIEKGATDYTGTLEIGTSVGNE